MNSWSLKPSTERWPIAWIEPVTKQSVHAMEILVYEVSKRCRRMRDRAATEGC